jgi:hypothetical protein
MPMKAMVYKTLSVSAQSLAFCLARLALLSHRQRALALTSR